MTTLTDDGVEWYGDRAIGLADRLSTIAVGTGSGNESSSASALDNQVFEADHSDSIVFFTDESQAGRIIAHIEITGGMEVSGGTQISEIGIFGGEKDQSGPLVWIDEFASVTIESGYTREFTVPINH